MGFRQSSSATTEVDAVYYSHLGARTRSARLPVMEVITRSNLTSAVAWSKFGNAGAGYRQ